MTNKRKIIVSSILLIIFAYFLILAIGNITADTLLSKNEIQSRVESLYNGKVDAIIEKDDQYAVTFSTENATYEVIVDAENARFSELELIFDKPDVAVTEEKTQTNKPSTTPPTAQPNSQEKPSAENPTSQKPIILTEQQAIAIAQKQFKGELEDINFYSTSEGGYYLVEIDGEQEEAVLQIHAVTGKILSVSFDD